MDPIRAGVGAARRLGGPLYVLVGRAALRKIRRDRLPKRRGTVFPEQWRHDADDRALAVGPKAGRRPIRGQLLVDEALIKRPRDVCDEPRAQVVVEAPVASEMENDPRRDDPSLGPRELGDVTRVVPLPLASDRTGERRSEAKVVEQIEHVLRVGFVNESHPHELAAHIGLRVLYSWLLEQSRQHGRESRASTKARGGASGEAAQAKNALDAHCAVSISMRLIHPLARAARALS